MERLPVLLRQARLRRRLTLRAAGQQLDEDIRVVVSWEAATWLPRTPAAVRILSDPDSMPPAPAPVPPVAAYQQAINVLEQRRELLKHERRRRGLSQRAAAAGLHVHKVSLGEWETGRADPTLSSAVRILRWLASLPPPERR